MLTDPQKAYIAKNWLRLSDWEMAKALDVKKTAIAAYRHKSKMHRAHPFMNIKKRKRGETPNGI